MNSVSFLTVSAYELATRSNLSPRQGGVTPGEIANEVVQEILARLWDQIGASGLYTGVLLVAKIFLGIGLIIVAYRTYYQITENRIGDYRSIVAAFVWPVVAIILLLEPPNLTGQVVTANTNIWNISRVLTGVFEFMNDQITVGLIGNGEDPRKVAENFNNFENEVINATRGCADLGDKELEIECQRQVAEQIQARASQGEIPQNHTIVNWAGNFLTNLKDQIVDGFQKFIGFIREPLTELRKQYVDPVLNGVLIALYVAFGLILELSMLLIATIAPIAVGASLIPLQQRTLLSWLSGIVALGMTKIAFNLITLMASYFAFDTNQSGINTAIFLILGVLAPFIAGSVGAFSAAGVQSGIGSLAAMMGGIAVIGGVNAATGAIGMIGGGVRGIFGMFRGR